ncbi:DUF4424 domain-containing protein [Rhizobium sullae]|uniref:Uncharacterized protein DUF4424 n=1 Tax=Rhizobium sullae TaxID=50338 RepID=A0A4R3Q0Y9_RHISU|nr:DUF4424 domain-containing protein [Rhizobium sullae]TCU14693.1 uncharacterized protein DUF4424 [Rhizobium sullae]
MKANVVTALIAPLVFATMVPTSVLANDTSAVLGAGGLELTTSKDIVMASEDLYLSASQIRVRYAFRNESDRDITTRVAFPLPEVNQNEGSEMAFLPAEDQENFVDFHVTVDGRPVQPKLEQKAVTGEGADVTAAITKAGLPVNAQLPGWQEKTRALPHEVRQHLIKQRLIEADDPGNRSADFDPTWKLRATFHWEQTFPAGKTITVEHRYKPITGGVSSFDESQFNDYKSYCLDNQGKAGVRRLMKQAQAAAQADPQRNPNIGGPSEVEYILTTGANWKGPIGDFHLTIDKENPNAVLTLCLSGLKKTGPTAFELRRMNFTPKEDIRFAVFDWR